ncbi:hypothetical protein NLI96_g46 [Meripilus lineatus]|uniref:Uncharacterized protein n=1 Tax=Meripilus lineatus TaxID=2056292 RepID=A0AAD5VIU9_9APHY|nr:hypothetical protein NLI96_g46 [Physisporinus lineatus]
MVAPQQFTKVDLTPRRHHGYAVFLFILGTLFPPLGDFWINVVLTICGYIPGHAHNFYIQNIRNNKTHRRTPKWAQRWGLVDTSEIKRKERRSQWAGRYNDRLPRSTLDSQPYEEGQEPGGSSIDLANEENGQQQNGRRGTVDGNGNGALWNQNDERYYGQQNGSANSVGSSGSGRWHYPANFEDAIVEQPSRKKSKSKKKEKKDRWARTEDAYSMNEADLDGHSHSRKRKSKSKKRKSSKNGEGDYLDTASRRSDSTTEFPEDAEGGLYGDTRKGPAPPRENEEDILNQEV